MNKALLTLLPFLFCSHVLAKTDHVVVVSLDGGGSNLLEKVQSSEIQKLVDEGVSTFDAKTIIPSITLPSHTSMLTGVSPSKHKITWNSWKPSKGVVTVPTVFSIAKDAGLTTAFFGAKDKFKHLVIKDSIDMFSILSSEAKEISEAAGEYFKTNRPNLMFVHFPDLDEEGHKNGWESKEQLAAMKNVDSAISNLKASISQGSGNDSFVLIVTADHGGRNKLHGGSEDDSLRIPWLAWGSQVVKGYVIQTSVSTMDTAATIIDLLGLAKVKGLDGSSLSPYLEN